jgi:hypothetical protein
MSNMVPTTVYISMMSEVIFILPAMRTIDGGIKVP